MGAGINSLPLTETITPADEAAVVAVVRNAAAKRTPVYPIGGATELHCGARPTQPGIGLQTCRLNSVLDYPADDMTITVEAGLTIAELQRQLAAQRQWLPVDVPRPDRATVGGVVAMCPSGPRRYAYGTIRDYVLGVRAVDGRGTVFSGGGRVVKNAAGYNMNRLLVGSLGTLGVITQVTLMVRPLPETSAWLSCEVPDADTAERLLAELVKTRTLPAAIELLVGQAVPDSSFVDTGGQIVRHSLTYRVLVAFEGSRVEVDWMIGQLGEEWRTAGIDHVVTTSDADAEKLWRDLTDFAADVQIHVLPSATVSLTARLRELFPACSILAHAGNGIVRMHLPEMADDDEARHDQRSRLYEVLEAVGGKSQILAGTPTMQARCPAPPTMLAVMRAIKQRFDPEGILNPGRAIFG
jgi:glycolate oxidase FAD binding subunit